MTIDPQTGVFAGDAWSESTGWISFGHAEADHRIRTSWSGCAFGGPPGGAPTLRAEPDGGDTSFRWDPLVDATDYDVVGGTLRQLVDSGGDFTTAVAQDCKITATEISITDPGPGEGFYVLVRGGNCAGSGTFDPQGHSGLIETRDAELGGLCP